MKVKAIIGSAVAATLLGVGILAGSVIGGGSVSAQTPAATATATPSTSTKDLSTLPIDSGGRHGRGMGGDFGRGGPGKGGPGAATAGGASAAISNTTTVINLAKGDLTFATGKMDTAAVQRWINGADSLLQSAQTANGSQQYGRAVGYASAARELAMTAISVMGQELGANTLPSYGQIGQGRHGSLPTDATTVTQAQARRMLAHTYDQLIAQGALIENASNASQAIPYLTEAQNAYRAAYDSYQAGNYSAAMQSAKLAERLARVAGSIVRAVAAPANVDTPVTVPAPNF